MNLRHLASFALPLLALAAFPGGASAQQNQQLLGQFTDWAAYSASAGGGKVCFAISQPKKRAPEGLNRDPAYFFVTNRPADKVKGEISMQVGFPMKAGDPTQVSIGSSNFNLVTQGERAWTNGKDDDQIVAAMRGGHDMTIKSTSTRGHVTTDTYSLAGISAALDKINQECR
ncbi:MAG TPA: invasion associated locus B family protein [Hyphomicrobiales bacterium]|nr:invasion associated locus B family protein [Hyphomicrobiales bacterium]